MTAEAWIALGALIFAMFGSTIGATAVILNKISANKQELDEDLTGIRLAAYEEYKVLRREMAEASDRAYDRFGESLIAIREKVTEVELWVRDQLTETRSSFNSNMEEHYKILAQKIEEIEKSLKALEIENARRHPG